MKKYFLYLTICFLICSIESYSQDLSLDVKNYYGTWQLHTRDKEDELQPTKNYKIFKTDGTVISRNVGGTDSTYKFKLEKKEDPLYKGTFYSNLLLIDPDDATDINSYKPDLIYNEIEKKFYLNLEYKGNNRNFTYIKMTYFNTSQTTPFKKSNCGTGEGESFDYTVAAGTYSSAVSQGDADSKAKADVAKNGQKYANEALGGCIYYNVAITKQFNTFPCPKGSIGSLISYTVPARTFNSEISQADANLMAEIRWNYAMKGAVFTNVGKCLFGNVAVTKNFTKMGCTGVKKGTVVPYTVKAGTYTAEKQGDADKLAQNDMIKNGQNNANSKGQCK